MEDLQQDMNDKMRVFAGEVERASERIFRNEIGFILLASPFDSDAGFAGTMGNMSTAASATLLKIALARVMLKLENE